MVDDGVVKEDSDLWTKKSSSRSTPKVPSNEIQRITESFSPGRGKHEFFVSNR